MRKLQLTKGKVAIVDDEDYEFLSKWKWSFSGEYAVRGVYLGKLNGKARYKRVYLHRLINNTPDDLETDHINRDKLDNRKANLRTVNRGQNNRNRDGYKNNLVGVAGINWYGSLGKYRALIVVNKARIHLGYFDRVEEAIAIRKLAEQKYYAI